uniref:RRP15-like protein n=1 Tax=Clastoptera arizonana TaxID=38151 RepID=A0A1B6CV65_9HEMI
MVLIKKISKKIDMHVQIDDKLESEYSSKMSDLEDSNEEKVLNFRITDSDNLNEGQPHLNSPVKDRSFHNENWADAMSKILKMNKPRKNKTLVLSRAKRVNVSKQPEENKLDFEIDGESEDVKSNIILESKSLKMNVIKKLKKKDWATKGHKKPSVLDRNRERALSKIATKGVVQLFNAVRTHQKTVNSKLEEAGSLEYQKDKVMKSLDKKSFLNVLMGNAKSCSIDDIVPSKIKEEDTSQQKWDVLKDNFMMTPKLKNWDKGVKDENVM